MGHNKILIITMDIEELKNLIKESIFEVLNVANSKSLKHADTSIELISRFDACRLFGVSKTTIDNWRKHNLLKGEVKIASRVYFEKNELVKLIADMKSRV
jgi:hypothetical protein